jgi:bifunctional UDP-N-acetylglucosamine pyrophosphorylase/glucosamine-1-phosphate N-acetyltransferase
MRTASLSAIVLAAGDGTRMRSTRPKPLHVLCGKAMLLYVIDSLGESKLDRVVVVTGRGGERVAKKLQAESAAHYFEYVEQQRPLGTADAVMTALSVFAADDDFDDSDVIVLPGDTPLVRPETIAALADEHERTGAAVTVLTARPADPRGYARVRRGKGDRAVALVDDEDQVDDDATDEISTGIYVFRRSLLAPAIRRILPRSRSGEVFLSDVVAVLAEAGHPVATHEVADPTEVVGVNDRVQLATAEAELRRRTNLAWLRRGVTMLDPSNTYVDTTVHLGADVTLFPGVLLQGRTIIGEGSEIGPNCRIVDSIVGRRCRVENSVVRDAEIGDESQVGPYAVVQRGAVVSSGTVTGPFYTAAAEE